MSSAKKWNMIIDVAECNNCYNCLITTKDEYVDQAFPGYTAAMPLHGHHWVDSERVEHGQWPMVQVDSRPIMCNHCDDGPCMDAAKDGAVYKREDGIVIIDPIKSKGQKQIVDACPHGAVYWNEELEIPQAWPFDAHLLDGGWEKTKLEHACPSDVFKSMKITDKEMDIIATDMDLETRNGKDGPRARVYYKNNHLFTTSFVGGTVVTNKSGVEDCVADVKVTAYKDGQALGNNTTDGFGEFKIDKIAKGIGEIQLKFEQNGAVIKEQQVDLPETKYIGLVEI